MSVPHPSASFSATLRVHLDNRPGSFAELATAIGSAGGLLGAIDLVRVERGKKIRDVTVLASDEAQVADVVDAVRALEGVEVEHVSDRTVLLHLGGKLEWSRRRRLRRETTSRWSIRPVLRASAGRSPTSRRRSGT
jgi:ACT domain